MQLGAKLCAGLEAAYLQGTGSATAALRWPSPKIPQAAVLPPATPWAQDAAFARHLSGLRPGLDAAAASSRRAFLQQSELGEPFRRAFLRALGERTLAEAVDLASFWRDADDAEDWLQVSAEELDREMAARQAEFDAYDRSRSSSASRGGVAARKVPDMEGSEAHRLQQDIAALGQEISGLLTRDSCLDGVEVSQAGTSTASGATSTSCVGGGQNESEDSGSDELDVLGLEDDEGSTSSGEEAEDHRGESHKGCGSLREYMTELDEQLESELDGKIPTGDVAGQERADGALPLGSHHIKVHHAGPMELDTHAMEHVLASYCAEHQLSPGPASLLLGELGLASEAAMGMRRTVADSEAGPPNAGLRPRGATSVEPCCLSVMD